jgi:hypothetical protein
MYKALSLLGFVIYVAVGVISYLLMAGTQTDWSQLVTYIWILFWPFIIFLALFYYRPVIILIVVTALIVGLRIARRRA